MKRNIGWLLVLAVALLLPSLALNFTLSAAGQEEQDRREVIGDVSSEPEYLSPGQRHKVRTSDRNLARDLASNGARLVADYGSHLLLEVDGEAARRVSKERRGEIRDDYNLIMLNAGAIDTTTRAAASLSGIKLNAAGKKMHLVQFAGPIMSEWVDDLIATGVEIVTYVPSNAYLVYGDNASLRRVQRMREAPRSVVQWEGSYFDDYKVHPNVYTRLKEQSREGFDAAKGEGGNLYTIQMINDPKANAATLALIDLYKTEPVKSQWGILKYVNLIVGLSPNAFKEIASRPDVVSIYPEIVPTKKDERQNQIIAGNLTGNLPTPGDWLAYLAGKGFTQAQFTASNFAVNVSDSGIDNATTSPNHPGLRVAGLAANASRVAYNRLEGTPNAGSTLQGCDGHGTINSHIVAGFVAASQASGFPHADASGFRYGMGVCPFVKVGSSVIFDPDTFTFPNSPNLESKGYNDGARISTNSWGAAVGGAYDVRAQTYDALVRDSQPAGSTFPTAGNQEMVIIFSAGNSGAGANTIGSPGTGKNIISVGAAENVQAFGGADFCGINDAGADNANDIISFSSRGPTDDGRVKPDIQAPGTHVSGGVFQQSATPPANGDADSCFDALGVCGGPGIDFFPAGQEFYTASSGTSHSAPAVAGAAALLRQDFINRSLTPPSPAMTKALMQNSARYMTGVGAGGNLPSNSQGMGELNLNGYFDIFGVANIIRDQRPVDTFTATGQQRVITGNIADNTKPFRVTLAWTDTPGPTVGNAFVNDLDLEVTVGGQTFRGNVFSGANSATGGVFDIRNNNESVFVPAGVSGPFVVRIIASNIAGDGVPGDADTTDQDFALVLVNGVEQQQAVIASAGATITTESCSPANGAVDPGETVTVSLCVQNVGTTATTNLVGTLAATGGVTSPSGPQSYGALAAGGPPVCRNFTFTANGACGSTITASLNLQDGATNLGTVTYTFTLGTLATAFTENFDGVTAPALPAGWTTSFVNGAGCALGSNWTTVTTPNDTAPNSAFHNDPNCITDNFLVTPAIAISSASAQLTFRRNNNLESTFDGMVLEISNPAINGGAFQDIITAGGSFVTGGYNATISVNFSSPIAGRQAWSGNSGGFTTTTVNLPASAMGASIQLRWRVATDTSVSGVGANVDTIVITDGFECCTASAQPCAENFDAVTVPALPAGWTATTAIDCANSNPWETSNAGTPTPPADSAPNAAFVNDPNCISDERLDSPAFPITSASATLTFRQNRNLENGFDGGVLEASINGGAFQDILATGATFAVGGYNGTISVNFGSPIAGRQAWTGNSAGFVTTTVNLPASANGQSWVFRWRRGSDSSVSGQGWRIDSITTTGTSCGGAVPCDLTCPANITVSNAPNQCGAVVNYPAPTSTGSCGTVTCSPPSGSFFPVGTTTVTCTGTGDTCSFTITVQDTQPPSITCPSNITVVGTPGQPGALVTFPPPTASDNCPGVTVVCTPPSGSTFPVGTTTVTCTATDASGNTATCSFTVTVFDICLQDDTNPSIVVLVNSFTGQYRFCCNGTVWTGTGKMQIQGNTFTLEHAATDRRVTVRLNNGLTPPSGSASLQAPPGTTRCTITDRDTRNNSCVCQ
ncbi:MAG TPA: S8 family serine peptidase [Blastocatellia bacterium]|nr:S8 family serine peptidase [Blastocatellia bacterium]